MSTIGLLASTEKTVKLGMIHMRPFQWHPNASKFSHSLDSENETTGGMVVEPTKRPVRRIPTPQGSRHLNLYRHLKRRLGRTLRSQLHWRPMVRCRKTARHKGPGTKGSDPSHSTLRDMVQHKTSTDCHGQHHCSSPHKQTRGDSLGGTLCPHVETPHLVQQIPDNTQSIDTSQVH